MTGTALPIVFFLPLFGFLSMLLVERILIEKKETLPNLAHDTTDDFQINHTKIVANEKEEPRKIIPLEEAILISDSATRRAVMMDILHKDPTQYLDLLMVARFNSDTEVTHYATTTIMRIQRDFELAIQRLALALKEESCDTQMLDQYIEILDKYIKSGLLQGHLLHQQRLKYASALERKRALFPHRKKTYFQIVDNSIGMGDLAYAEETVRFMQRKWPSDENVWLTAMRVCVESGNRAGKADLIDLMKRTPITWTANGRERMLFWCGPQFFKSIRRAKKESAVSL